MGNILLMESLVFSGHSPPFYSIFCSTCRPIQFIRLHLIVGALSPKPAITSSKTSSIAKQWLSSLRVEKVY